MTRYVGCLACVFVRASTPSLRRLPGALPDGSHPKTVLSSRRRCTLKQTPKAAEVIKRLPRSYTLQRIFIATPVHRPCVRAPKRFRCPPFAHRHTRDRFRFQNMKGLLPPRSYLTQPNLFSRSFPRLITLFYLLLSRGKRDEPSKTVSEKCAGDDERLDGTALCVR